MNLQSKTYLSIKFFLSKARFFHFGGLAKFQEGLSLRPIWSKFGHQTGLYMGWKNVWTIEIEVWKTWDRDRILAKLVLGLKFLIIIIQLQ